MRRLNGTRSQYDFFACFQYSQLTVDGHLNSYSTLAFKQHTLNHGLGVHSKVFAVQVRKQIGTRCAPAFTIFLGHLVNANAFLVGTVEIISDLETSLLASFQINLLKGIVGTQIGHIQRAAVAVVGVANSLVAFTEFKIRQHVFVRPAAAPLFIGPTVVVRCRATNVNHGIDGRGTTQGLATRLVTLATVQAGLRCSFECPVVDFGGQHGHRTAGNIDQITGAIAPGFEKAYIEC